MFIGLLSAVEKFFSFFEPRGKPCFGLFGTTFKLGGGGEERGYRGIRVEQQRDTAPFSFLRANIRIYMYKGYYSCKCCVYVYIFFKVRPVS